MEIHELVMLSWRGGHLSGKGLLKGKEASTERHRILKITAELTDELNQCRTTLVEREAVLEAVRGNFKNAMEWYKNKLAEREAELAGLREKIDWYWQCYDVHSFIYRGKSSPITDSHIEIALSLHLAEDELRATVGKEE